VFNPDKQNNGQFLLVTKDKGFATAEMLNFPFQL